MSFFDELKRRNVFRVGLAYIVAAWVLLQVTDVLVPLLTLPEAAGRFVLLLLLIGFIPVLLFSWAYELTPDGLKRDRDVSGNTAHAGQAAKRLNTITVGLLIAAIVIVGVDRLLPEQARPVDPTSSEPEVPVEAVTSEPQAESPDPSTQKATSVAVLPFANMSPDPANEYFADGISEELLNVLATTSALRVPSRTSSFAFKGQNRDIREIAAELDVNHVLEGSVRKAGNQVRITAQLIDVETDTHLWSDTYDRDLEDIFAIQDEIAGHIVDALKIALSIDAQSPPTKNLDAYTLYLQARELFRRRGESLLEADRLLAEAVELDPEFADAWALQALVQATLPGYVKKDKQPYFESALALSERALSLDPTQPDAMLAQGHVMALRGQLAESFEQFNAVLDQQPGHATARLWLGIGLLEAGYVNEALAKLKIARGYDPANATLLDWYARTAIATGEDEQALEAARISLRLGRAQARVPMFYYFLQQQDLPGLQASIGEPSAPAWDWMTRVFEVQRDPDKLANAMAWADQAEQAGAGYYIEYARLNFLLVGDDSASFFEQLNLIERVDGTIASVLWLPSVQSHRQSKAMQQWARQSGKLDLWRSRGWPDLCRPLGDNDFECGL